MNAIIESEMRQYIRKHYAGDIKNAAMLSAKESARLLDVTEAAIRALPIARYDVSAKRDGTRIRYRLRDLEAFQESRRISPKMARI